MAPSSAATSTSERLLDAAAELLREGGVDAVSTRAVAAAAGTQPPILYRRFGDKNGLLEAATLHILQGYLTKKRALLKHSEDPVADLARLWDLFVAFGFAQPDCFGWIYGHPRQGDSVATAAAATVSVLQDAVARVAAHGKLRMSVERATALFHSCGVGFVLTQLQVPIADRDPDLSEIACKAALSNIVASTGLRRGRSATSARAAALREALRDGSDVPLTLAEQQLLSEWLNRISDRQHR
ncbi:TetR/AcrR family transcriptional regulator [Mycolicibacterium psychrotolerans]|uniref:TetR/AcrR family transcriptional regulator n=1 Tax=Mycolicibacterium psychrotolerans TaxID=216929 RepID=UPI003D6790C7